MDDTVTCPYCGEEIDLAIDQGGGQAQEYVEDCEVCCRPMRVSVSASDEGEYAASVSRLD
ncbi:MAG: CPXCG motif-containing cysteine-rich protein [Myxococcales bacterium]|nr:CPXCG motif-containing cysteine-rich protein [Myxococcales bacterium]